jgi:hypothetical protein
MSRKLQRDRTHHRPSEIDNKLTTTRRNYKFIEQREAKVEPRNSFGGKQLLESQALQIFESPTLPYLYLCLKYEN